MARDQAIKKCMAALKADPDRKKAGAVVFDSLTQSCLDRVDPSVKQTAEAERASTRDVAIAAIGASTIDSMFCAEMARNGVRMCYIITAMGHKDMPKMDYNEGASTTEVGSKPS